MAVSGRNESAKGGTLLRKVYDGSSIKSRHPPRFNEIQRDSTRFNNMQHEVGKISDTPAESETAQSNPPAKAAGFTAKLMLKGAGIAFVGLVWNKVLISVTNVVLARKLGVHDYGLYNWIFSLMTVAAVLLALGFPMSFSRYTPIYLKNGEHSVLKRNILFAIFYVFIVGSLISVLVLYMSDTISLNFFKEPTFAPVLSIFIVGLPFLGMRLVVAGALQGLKAIKYSTYAGNILGPALRFVLVFAFIFFSELNLINVAYIHSVVYFLTFVLGFYFLIKVFPSGLFPLEINLPSGDFFKFALSLFLVNLLTNFRPQFNIAMLGNFATPTEVGLYSAGFSIIQALFLILTSFRYIALPVFSELMVQEKWTELRGLYKKISNIILYTSFPLFIILMAFPGDTLSTFFGPPFASGATAFQIMLAAFMIQSYVGLSGMVMVSAGKTKQHLVFDIVSLVALMVAIFGLVPAYGLEGAAVALGISSIVVVGLNCFYVGHFFGLIPFTNKGLMFILYSSAYILLSKVLLNWFSVGISIPVLVTLPALLILLIHATRYLLYGWEDMELMVFEKIKKEIRNSSYFKNKGQ